MLHACFHLRPELHLQLNREMGCKSDTKWVDNENSSTFLTMNSASTSLNTSFLTYCVVLAVHGPEGRTCHDARMLSEFPAKLLRSCVWEGEGRLGRDEVHRRRFRYVCCEYQTSTFPFYFLYWDHQTTGYRYEFTICPLSCFASANS